MKNIFLLICIIICSNLNAQGDEKTTFRDEILNGKIKVIKEIIYQYDNVDTLLYFFNESGLLEEEIQYYEHIIYSYNSDNKIIKSTTYNVNFGGIESHSNEYIYEDGFLVTHILKYPSSTPEYDYYVTHYTYNINRKLGEETKFRKQKQDNKETFFYHYKYQYDSIGNKIKVERFEENGAMWEKIENKYINNKLIETFTWKVFEGEDLYLKSIYVYDENENLESLIKIVYNYGSTTSIQNSFTTNYLYDDQQRLIKIFEPGYPNKEITSYSDFDIKDNWQQKIFTDYKGNQRKIIREIEYYNE